MSGFDSKDRLPMAAAVLILVVGNAISYALGLTLYVTILVTPLAVVAFSAVRYALYGSPVPDGIAVN
jgi:hypothetical protein